MFETSAEVNVGIC